MAQIERERLTVTNAVIQLSKRADQGLIGAQLSFEAQPIRVTWDGTDPVAGATAAAKGHLFDPSSAVEPLILELNGREAIANFKAIRNGGTDGYIEVTYKMRF